MSKYESIPIIQPESVESTKGMNRIPIATRIPNSVDDVVQKIKGKRVARETSSPRPSLKVRIRRQKPSTTTPISPPSDDREQDEIHEATQLSLALHKTTKLAEEQENMVAVKEKLLEEDVEKIVEGEDDESYASDFEDYVFLNEEDFSSRLEPGSHKKNPEDVDDDEKKYDKKDDEDDNDDDDQDDHVLNRNRRTGSLEIRNEKMQTHIPSPPKSPRKDLFANKAIAEELTVSVSPPPATSSQIRSKHISSKYTHIPQALRIMCRRQDSMLQHVLKKYVTNRHFQDIKEKVHVVLYDIVPKISSNTTKDLIDDNLLRIVANAVKKD
nr:hypothetical protein [Tanacetum cinerariifolium]